MAGFPRRTAGIYAIPDNFLWVEVKRSRHLGHYSIKDTFTQKTVVEAQAL